MLFMTSEMAAPQGEEHRAAMLFADAKRRGSVASGRRLYISAWMRPKAFWNIIIIDRHSLRLEDEALLFIMLHEEAHMVNPQNTRWLRWPALPVASAYAAASIGWSMGLVGTGLYLASLTLTAAYVTAFMGVLLLAKGWLAQDELQADAWAAAAMVRLHGAKDPAAAATAALSSGPAPMTWAARAAAGLRRRLGYHPCLRERVSNIWDSMERSDN